MSPFIDANIGTAVGGWAGSVILRTINGGETWTSQSSGTTISLRGVCFTDANNGTAVGEGWSVTNYESNILEDHKWWRNMDCANKWNYRRGMVE